MSAIAPIQDFDDPTYDPFISDEASFGDHRDPYPLVAQWLKQSPIHRLDYRVGMGLAPEQLYEGRDLALTTDLIVGFPGETEDDFLETVSAVEEFGFDSAFTFVYSVRAGTEAAAMSEQVSEEVKRERIERLVEVVQRVAASRNAERVGRTEEVLVESPSRTDPQLLRGRTRRNTTVNFAGAAVAGDLVEVRIEAATSTTLRGVQAVPVAA